MRVLMTTDTIGGVWTFTQELAAGLLELGCKVALVSTGGPQTEDQRKWCERMDSSWGSGFWSLSVDGPLEWMQENTGAFTKAASLLVKVAKEFGADVVHCNQFCFGALAVELPRIVTAHSDVLSWAESCRDVPLEDSKWLRRYCSLVRTGLAEAEAVIAPTQWMLSALGRNFRLPELQLAIPNGRKIDRTPHRPRKLQAVTVGRLWDEAKNVAPLSSVPSAQRILIAGETTCEKTSAPTFSGSAEYLGTLSHEALMALFSESSIYICTSRYEPFGLAPLEAALCGCAVIANDIPSLREVWGDGALYFRDPNGLSQLLSGLYADEVFLKRARRRSFERSKRYSREAMASSYLALFNQVTASQRDLCHVA